MSRKNEKRNYVSCVKLFSKQQMNEWMNELYLSVRVFSYYAKRGH